MSTNTMFLRLRISKTKCFRVNAVASPIFIVLDSQAGGARGFCERVGPPRSSARRQDSKKSIEIPGTRKSKK